MRLSRLILPITIVLSLMGLGHYYLWVRLASVTALPGPWPAAIGALLVVLALSIPFAFFATRRWSRARAEPVAWLAYTWMGLGLYLLLALAVSDLVRIGFALADADRPEPRLVASLVVFAATAIAFAGLVRVARGFVVRRVRVPLATLPAAGEGYTIVQLTDVHIGPTLGRDFAERVVRGANALEPDLIVITGDLVDGTVDALRAHVQPLGQLRATDGVYFVTGNHEYYWDADAWVGHVKSLGIRPLRNERVTVRGAFELAGVDDVTAAGMLRGHGEDMAAAVAGRDPALPLVLLAHHPRAAERAAAVGADLQLSGHVHGGQMLPLGWLARIREPHIAGLFRVRDMWLYVSQGTGYWGPPLRVGTTAEITHITLVCEDAKR